MQIKRKTKLTVLGIVIVIIGLLVGTIPLFIQDKKDKDDNKKVEDFIKNTSTKEDKKENNNDKKEEYLLVLEIPKINLKRGVYPQDSKENTIEKNVSIMKESTLPNEANSNLILEAHNGNADIAYFNKIDRLSKNDEVYIYYEGTKYIYKVNNIYDVSKDGNVEVYREINKNTLTLITCKTNTDDKQIVVILYLSKKEEY